MSTAEVAHCKWCGDFPRATIGPIRAALDAAENCAHFAARAARARAL
jgi:hypothetical protein